MKSAIITGASRGLGLTLASFLASQNYNLILTARDKDSLNKATEGLANDSSQIIKVAGDITDATHRQAVAKAAKSLGSIGFLVNNASELGPSPLPYLQDYPLKDFSSVLNTNVIAPLGLIQVVLPFMNTAGLIINISSDAAIGGYEGWGGYGASKAALDLVSKTLANELADKNIGVVSVDPGDMRTKMHQDAFPNEDISDRPLPEVTLPFWAWLLGQKIEAVSGQRFQAQGKLWEVAK